MFSCLSVDEESSLKKSELVNWYLKEIESEIDSEAELIARKNLIEKVLHRLVHYVSVDLNNELRQRLNFICCIRMKQKLCILTGKFRSHFTRVGEWRNFRTAIENGKVFLNLMSCRDSTGQMIGSGKSLRPVILTF